MAAPFHSVCLRITQETPLGSGPFKAIMTTDASLPEHVIYHPANLEAAGTLPIVSWGNGAGMHAGNRFRIFLTEIASHGFLVISAGRLEDPALEVGPQENLAVRRPGDPPPPPAIPVDPASARARRSTVDHMRQAIDWAVQQHTLPSSRFRGRLDPTTIAVAGQSCGAGLPTQLASDPRVTTVGMFNSGTRRGRRRIARAHRRRLVRLAAPRRGAGRADVQRAGRHAVHRTDLARVEKEDRLATGATEANRPVGVPGDVSAAAARTRCYS